MIEYLYNSFAFLLFSAGIFILVAAANIPYWSKTDRLWKIEINEKEEEDDAS